MAVHRCCISVLVLACLGSCGHGPSPGREAAAVSKPPQALVVEREITLVGKERALRFPLGLAAAGPQSIFLSDAGGNFVTVLDSAFNVRAEAGGFGFASGAFNRPSYISVDNHLQVWITDEGNRRVVRYDQRLNFVDELPLPGESETTFVLVAPSGLAVNAYGELWVADRTENRVAVFDNTGRLGRFIGEIGYPGGGLRQPEKIVCDSDGSFLVCDAGNARLVRYDAYGSYVNKIESPAFTHPVSVAVTAAALWVIDSRAGRLFCMTPSGELLFEAGPQLMGSPRPLSDPRDVIALSDERLLIADSGNARLLLCRVIRQ